MEGSTLDQVVSSVEKVLKKVANDGRLQASIAKFVEENGNSKVELEEE